MFAMALMEAVGNLWLEVAAAIIVLFVGWSWGRWRASVSWKRREFHNRVVLSLNCLTWQEKDGKKKPKLQLRTLFEKDLLELLQNHLMVDLVIKSVKNVKDNDPLVRLPEKDSWHILNALLNQIVEKFAEGTLRKDMGLQVTSKTYVFCLTYETAGEMRTRKPRIMMMEKEAWKAFPDVDVNEFVLESPIHENRVKTLQYLKGEIEKSAHLFREIEISV